MTADDAHDKLVRALEHYVTLGERAETDRQLQVAERLVQPLALVSIAFELREIRAALQPISVPR